MLFERTYDYALLNRLLCESNLYPWISDDFAPPVEDVAVVESPHLWYILASEGGKPFGFWMFEQRSTTVMEFHTVMPLDKRALAAMRALLGRAGWLWNNTGCRRAITYVPSFNKIALRFGLRAGLAEYGRDPHSYQKNGLLHTRILLGVSKP